MQVLNLSTEHRKPIVFCVASAAPELTPTDRTGIEALPAALVRDVLGMAGDGNCGSWGHPAAIQSGCFLVFRRADQGHSFC